MEIGTSLFKALSFFPLLPLSNALSLIWWSVSRRKVTILLYDITALRGKFAKD